MKGHSYRAGVTYIRVKGHSCQGEGAHDHVRVKGHLYQGGGGIPIRAEGHVYQGSNV